MSDQPTGYSWFTALVRMTGTQSNAFLAMLWDLKRILESFANPEGDVVVIWANSVYQPGTTNLQRLPDCLMKLQKYCDAHGGDPTGFLYVPEGSPWWAGKTTPPSFKAYAGPKGARIWHIPSATPVTVGIADTVTPLYTRPQGFEMDVSLIIARENEPTWFVVFEYGGYKWICLAGETTQSAGG